MKYRGGAVPMSSPDSIWLDDRDFRPPDRRFAVSPFGGQREFRPSPPSARTKSVPVSALLLYRGAEIQGVRAFQTGKLIALQQTALSSEANYEPSNRAARVYRRSRLSSEC